MRFGHGARSFRRTIGTRLADLDARATSLRPLAAYRRSCARVMFEPDAAKVIIRKGKSSLVALGKGFRSAYVRLVPVSRAERLFNSLKHAIFRTSLRHRLAAKSCIFMFCRAWVPLTMGKSEGIHEP